MPSETEIKTSAEVEEPIFRCITKGVQGDADQFEFGLSWVTSRRAILKIYSDRIECGNWSIPFASFEQAILSETKQTFIPCYVLKIRTADNSYQFGLNPNKFWSGGLPFEVERQKGRLKYSTFSIVLRVILVAAIIWYFYLKL